MASALGVDTDLAVAAVDDGLADGEAEARALHVVVELDETLEDGRLLVLGDAGAGVLAVKVEPPDEARLECLFKLYEKMTGNTNNSSKK